MLSDLILFLFRALSLNDDAKKIERQRVTHKKVSLSLSILKFSHEVLFARV
jgi:hypothetical protein